MNDIDYAIAAYIEERVDGRYDEVIKPEGRWEIFTQLSELRTSLFNWYEFPEGARILQIYPGYGAVTGSFVRRGLSVTAVEPDSFKATCIKRRFESFPNLSVDNMQLEEFFACNDVLYDYIVLVDVLKSGKGGQRLIESLATALKPSGKLLIANPNKFGLRYLCGNGEQWSHVPFAGLDGDGTLHFSRSELAGLVRESGFGWVKFFYPLPTHTITQVVYTDGHLPQANIGERVSFYGDRKDEELVADERKLYREAVENKAFPFLANSFFVECSRTDNLSDVTYATVTTDRGFESASATVIREGRVDKFCVYPEGRLSIDRLYANAAMLKQRGLQVVPHKLTAPGVVRMPFVNAPTLSDVLREAVEKGDGARFVALFDRLWDHILSSSDDSSTNAFPEAGDLDYGPILSTALIDMIPLNCFVYDEDLVFFDQEFSRTDWPANYVMFRAIRYTYSANPMATTVVPLFDLAGRYGIAKPLWDRYEAEENKFINANRRYDLYQCFYYKTVWDNKKISENRKRLAGGES